MTTTTEPVHVSVPLSAVMAQAYLYGLGADPEAIRAECVKFGVRGKMGYPTQCAIASLLERKFGVQYLVSAFGIRVKGLGNGGEFPTPYGVQRFITNFDRNEYPELVGTYAGDPFCGDYVV